MPDEPSQPLADSLQKELTYLAARTDELTGQVIRADSQLSRAKRELRQRRQALALLSELQTRTRADMPADEVVHAALQLAAGTLKMDRTVLLWAQADGVFTVRQSLGYDAPAQQRLALLQLRVDDAIRQPQLVTAASAITSLTELLRTALELPFFTAVPVVQGARMAGVIVSGRMREAKPFFPPLDEGDLATWQSVAGFLGAALLNGELFHRVSHMASRFARFVPAEFLELLGRPSVVEVELGDQRQLEMAVLFSDIRGFTSISERLSPSQTFAFVNAYLAKTAPVIRRHNGFIDKYIGDAIMALFPTGAADAIAAACELQPAVAAFNASPPFPGLPPVAAGAGVHSGLLMLGTVGFEDRMDSTVIADAVNLASRVEGLNKLYGTSVLASSSAWETVPPARRLPHRTVDRVMVKGKHEPIDVIDVFAGDPPEVRSAKQSTLVTFTAAFAAYTTGDITTATTHFQSVIATDPTDTAAQLLLSRCREMQVQGVPVGWSGVTKLDHK